VFGKIRLALWGNDGSDMGQARGCGLGLNTLGSRKVENRLRIEPRARPGTPCKTYCVFQRGGGGFSCPRGVSLGGNWEPGCTLLGPLKNSGASGSVSNRLLFEKSPCSGQKLNAQETKEGRFVNTSRHCSKIRTSSLDTAMGLGRPGGVGA